MGPTRREVLVRIRPAVAVAVVLAGLGPAVGGAASRFIPAAEQRVCDPETLASSCPIPDPTRPTATGAAMTLGALRRYGADHRVYWAGPRPGTIYELSEAAGGDTSIRYLPTGAAVGTLTAYRTVVTSPFPDAFAIVRTYAQAAGSVRVPAPHAVAFYDRRKPKRVYLAFAGAPYEIEVSDPVPGAAIALVRSGRIRPIG